MFKFWLIRLILTVPVYAPVCPGSLQPAGRSETGRIGTEFECVHIFLALLRTRPGLGHKLITVCPGNATVCDGAFPVKIRRRYGVSRRVPIHHGSAPGIGARARLSLRRVTEVGRQSTGVSRQLTNINDFFVKLITEMSFAKYRT